MGDITSTCTIRYGALSTGETEIIVETPTTTDTGDTVVLTLAAYGITTFLSHEGFVHTTANSVVVAEQGTTSVTSGVLTLTVGGSTVSDTMRVYYIKGKGSK